MAHRVQHQRHAPASVEAVLDVALTVEDVLHWFPVPLEAVDVPASGRLAAGEGCVADALLAGRRLRTRITILEADASRYRLSAVGPLRFEVDAALRPDVGGCWIDATIETRSGGGLEGRLLEAASRPLLGPGLRRGLKRIAELAVERDSGRAAA